jgi:hypothetical protein
VVQLVMPDDAALRGTIGAQRAGTATAEQLALLSDVAQATLPDPVTVTKFLLWFAWKDGSGRWQPGWEPYDTVDLANGAARIKQASGDYANPAVSGPHAITLPGTP